MADTRPLHGLNDVDSTSLQRRVPSWCEQQNKNRAAKRRQNASRKTQRINNRQII